MYEWDSIVDAVSSDKEFMQQTIQEAKEVDSKLAAPKHKHKHHHDHSLTQTKDEEDEDDDAPKGTLSERAAGSVNDDLLKGLSESSFRSCDLAQG